MRCESYDQAEISMHHNAFGCLLTSVFHRILGLEVSARWIGLCLSASAEAGLQKWVLSRMKRILRVAGMGGPHLGRHGCSRGQ